MTQGGQGKMRFTRIAFCCLMLIAVAASVVAFQLVSAQSAQAYNKPVVVTHGDHFVYRVTGKRVVLKGVVISFRSKNLDKLTKLGVNFVRVRVPWAPFEPSPGNFNSRAWKQL